MIIYIYVRYAPAQDPPPFFQTSVTSVAVLFQRFDGKEGRRFSHQQQHLLGPRVRCGHQLPLGEQGADLRGPGLWHRHVSARAPPWAASWAWEVVENARLSRFERLHRERYIYIYIYINAYLDGQKKSFLDSTCFNMKFAPRALSCMTTAIWILRCFASLPATGCHAVGVSVISFHPEKLKEFN